MPLRISCRDRDGKIKFPKEVEVQLGPSQPGMHLVLRGWGGAHGVGPALGRLQTGWGSLAMAPLSPYPSLWRPSLSPALSGQVVTAGGGETVP